MEVGHKEFAKLVARCYERKVPLDVKGATGIGKSWVVKDEAQKIANQKKKKFVEWNEISDDQKRQLLKPELINKAFIFADIRLSQMDPSDLRGLPSLEGNTVEWKPNLIWKVLSNPEADGIVFFDEMNLSCPSIQASAYQIINDHQIGEIAISKNVFMISAGNRLCFKGDLLILGQDNQLIKEVKKGDKVFCKNGLGVVKDVMKRKYNGDMIKVRGRYLLPYEATPEHPIRVVPYKEKDTHTTTIKVFDNECWMTIKEVYDSFKQGNKFMLVVPRIKGIRGGKRGSFIPMVKYAKPKQRNQAFKHTGVGIGITMNQNIAWLMGLYLAEGWSSKTHVNFGLGAHETDIIKKLCGISNNQLKHKAFISKVRKGAVTVSICSSLLATAFKDWFGQGAKNKQIPWFVMQHKPNLIVKSFIRGYFDGDGSICKAPKTGRVQISATTVSKVLAIQLQLLTSSFGVIGSITVVKGGKDMIRGKPFNRSERYLISYNNTVMHTILGIGTDKKHKGNKFNYVKKERT